MEWIAAPEYWVGRLLLQRALAAIYLVAFVAALRQFRPLLGERGLLPVPRYLARAGWRDAPTLFQWRYSDRLLLVVAWSGIVLAAAALLGVTEAGPWWASTAAWLVLWALYLSIVNVGQVFYAFGWESLLLEAGFLAAFLGPADTAPPVVVLWLVRWLLFRVELGAGLIKLRGDPCWRDLSCLDHHHETQPLPGPLSRAFHLLPRPLHRVEVLANHTAQLVVPFTLFLPQPIASVGAAVIVVTQLWLVASGNFAWLNALTIALALSVLDQASVDAVLDVSRPELADPTVAHASLALAVAAVIAVLSWWPVRNLLSGRQRMNASFNRLHLANTYGAFGTVTRERHEVVVEGTDDADPGPRSEWREYEFRGKPGDPTRRPPQVAPYHLRLDWLMWFLPLSPAYGRGWFDLFLLRLLEGDPATRRLLRHDPFADAPPAVVRARLFHYRYATRRERRETGAFWVRRPVGVFSPPVRRRQPDDGPAAT